MVEESFLIKMYSCGTLLYSFLTKNDSSTILYIISGKPISHMKFDESSTGLPAGMGLLHKVVNGRAYTWDFEWDKSSSSYYYDWFPAEYGRENSIWYTFMRIKYHREMA